MGVSKRCSAYLRYLDYLTYSYYNLDKIRCSVYLHCLGYLAYLFITYIIYVAQLTYAS